MITLEAISSAENKTWLTQAIRDYADDKVSSGNWDASEALGLDTIGLHVFAHNTPARALYEKAGYAVTNINMAKKLTA